MPSRSDFDPTNAPVYLLVEEVLLLRADLARIAAGIVQQALERDWCGEYESWSRIINRQLSRPHLIYREDLTNDPSEHDIPPQIANELKALMKRWEYDA